MIYLGLGNDFLRYRYFFQRGRDNPLDGGFEPILWYKLVKFVQIHLIYAIRYPLPRW